MDGFNEKSTEQVQEQQPLGCLRRFSKTIKVIIIGGLIILLMIPMFMIESRPFSCFRTNFWSMDN